MDLWTLGEEGGELLTLLDRESWSTTGMPLGVEAGVSLVGEGIPPATD
jgi:hypothetical protein